MDTIFFCCTRISCSSSIQYRNVRFEIIQMYSIVVNRGDDRMHEVIFVVSSACIRQIHTPRLSIHRGMKSPGRSVSWRAIANLGSTRPLDGPFPSRLVTVTPGLYYDFVGNTKSL